MYAVLFIDGPLLTVYDIIGYFGGSKEFSDAINLMKSFRMQQQATFLLAICSSTGCRIYYINDFDF